MIEPEMANRLADADDEPDTGKPPCIFCRRVIPCECMGGPCMCSCGRCMAPYPWEIPAPDTQPPHDHE